MAHGGRADTHRHAGCNQQGPEKAGEPLDAFADIEHQPVPADQVQRVTVRDIGIILLRVLAPEFPKERQDDQADTKFAWPADTCHTSPYYA